MLAMSGLVDVRRFEPYVSTAGFQFEGTFSATTEGLAAGCVLRAAPQGEQLYRYLLDLCLGTVKGVWDDQPDESQFSQERLNVVLRADLTYRQAVARDTAMLFVEEGDPEAVTPTAVQLNRISEILSERIEVNRRDVLGAYQKILAVRQD
jgi:hypothetical protein